MVLIALAAMLQSGGATAVQDTSLSADMRRGAAAVGTRTSAAPALRQEQTAHPVSTGFAFGAALQAWRNAAETVAYDSTHVTGDGGDAGLLREACSDERIAFNRLEQGLRAVGATPDQALSAADAPPGLHKSWRERQSNAPSACR